MGYAAKLCFDAIQVGGNFAGSFMGLAMAQHYDPHQETQSQVIAEIQMALAMLLFLALDGHHLMLKTAFDSYAIVGLGQLKFTEEFARRLIEITGQVLVIGLQIAGPVGLSIFAVNVGFGIMGKAMPNLNILVLSLGVTCLIGLLVVFLSTPHLVAICAGVFERMSLWMRQLMLGLVAHGR
jgi:flagellar biosynthesis protein FliR